MQKEELLSILPRNREWFVIPTCVEAETRWGHFLVKTKQEGKMLQPVPCTVQIGETETCVHTIQKIGVGEQTRLVVAPYPGLLLGRDQVRRSLMEHPKGESFFHEYTLQMYMHEQLEIPLDTQWYVSGMIRLIQDVVIGGMNAQAFTDMLHTFEQLYSLGS